MKVTPAQQRVLRWVETFQDRNDGLSPTLQEIADGAKLGTKVNVKAHVDKLVDKGLISRVDHSGRSIQLTDQWRRLKNSEADKRANPMVAVVYEEQPDLFTDFTDDEWTRLRSIRGVGGALTREGVIKFATWINEDRELMKKIADLLKVGKTREELKAWIEAKHDSIKPGRKRQRRTKKTG